jgi:hypothetical protein
MTATSVDTSSAKPDPVLARRITTALQQLRVIGQQLASLREQLAELQRRQTALYDELAPVLRKPEKPDYVQPADSLPAAGETEDVLARCAQDVVHVLHEAGHPLTVPEILDGLVHRRLSWRENVVRHTLDALRDHGVVTDTSHLRPHSYGLQPASPL